MVWQLTRHLHVQAMQHMLCSPAAAASHAGASTSSTVLCQHTLPACWPLTSGLSAGRRTPRAAHPQCSGSGGNACAPEPRAPAPLAWVLGRHHHL
jgi:hypothetical protein